MSTTKFKVGDRVHRIGWPTGPGRIHSIGSTSAMVYWDVRPDCWSSVLLKELERLDEPAAYIRIIGASPGRYRAWVEAIVEEQVATGGHDGPEAWDAAERRAAWLCGCLDSLRVFGGYRTVRDR